jgi:hypothetical protein
MGNDRLIGSPTCKDVSLIDYVISSPMCLSMFSSFDVLEFSSLYSDVHCPVTFTLLIDKEVTNKNTDNNFQNVDLEPKPKNNKDI